ncbi:hypothetical protein ACWD25_15385 [Streptomyces sp. NPDC002920]
MPGPRGASVADITALLREGHSNKGIGRRLHTSPHRVARIRQEAGLPNWRPGSSLTLQQRWEVHARPARGGHMRWAGSLRGGTPNLVWRQDNYSARRVAFVIGHGREPIGKVLPDCGLAWCIAPEHTTDGPMRRADHLYKRMFGRAA